MHSDILEKYVDAVYAYAVKRTYTAEEAADLSQEILFTALHELPKLRQADRFEPWLWGIAGNVTRSFQRRMGKQRAMFSYDVPEEMLHAEEDPSENEEAYAALRAKIAMLSAIYRDIIIFYYYDGLSTKQISERLHIPAGTVTWRLSEARRKLKKECDGMETTALRPVKLKLDIYGTGNYDGKERPFPSAYINDALSQNILYYCYEEPHGVEELAKLCGVPAYYIEERIANLVKREAVIEPVKGKYQTDFIIWSDKYGIYCEENAEKAMMPIMDRMIEALQNIAKDAGKIDFYKAEKSEKDLFYLYGVLAFAYAREHYCRLPYPNMQEKYDGFCWNYVGNMESGKHKRISIGTMHCGNAGSRGNYTHTVYNSIGGFAYKEMMWDTWINACEDILLRGDSDDKETVAMAVQKGYILRMANGSLFVPTPAFTKAQKEELDAITEKYLAPLMDEYSALAERFIAGYKKLFPKHLHADADRMCQHIFFSLYAVIIAYAQRTGAIEPPTKNTYCDVLVQFK